MLARLYKVFPENRLKRNQEHNQTINMSETVKSVKTTWCFQFWNPQAREQTEQPMSRNPSN